MEPIVERGLSERYGAWWLDKRPAVWSIRFYLLLGAALLVFGASLWSRNLQAAALWSALGCLAILVGHELFLTRQARSAIDRLETENARLREQLGKS